MVDRNIYGKIAEVVSPQNLIEVQINSYKEFLQEFIAPVRLK